MYQDIPEISRADREVSSFAATVTAMDSAVGDIVDALKRSNIYDNSVIIFSTDNGGYAQNSNKPLKGGKNSFYEGGVRGVGFVHSPLIKNPKRSQKYRGLTFISDWFATILSLAGMEN